MASGNYFRRNGKHMEDPGVVVSIRIQVSQTSLRLKDYKSMTELEKEVKAILHDYLQGLGLSSAVFNYPDDYDKILEWIQRGDGLAIKEILTLISRREREAVEEVKKYYYAHDEIQVLRNTIDRLQSQVKVLREALSKAHECIVVYATPRMSMGPISEVDSSLDRKNIDETILKIEGVLESTKGADE